jgi:hypothetical protein
MKKYLAGGKATAGNNSCIKEDCSQTNKDFSAMLAARDRQISDLWSSPVQQQTPINQNQIVVHKPVQQVQNKKQVDINTILEGDY